MAFPLTGLRAVIQVAKAVSHSLNNCVNCLPGQKDVDIALRSIGEASKKLLVDIVSHCENTREFLIEPERGGFYRRGCRNRIESNDLLIIVMMNNKNNRHSLNIV